MPGLPDAPLFCEARAVARLHTLLRREAPWLVVVAALGAARVLVLALALPFFTNVDEYRHVDMVLKYARGWVPVAGDDGYELELARLVGTLGSPEYHRDPTRPQSVPMRPPVWQAGPEAALRRIAEAEALLAPRHNLEAYGPPFYYALAGAWLAAGRALGLRDAELLYWVRGLSALFVFALVLAAWLALREIYPREPLLRVGVPLLVALFPQDCLSYVTGDALSPLLAGVCFLLVVRLVLRPGPGAALAALAGATGAAAILTKYPNVALIPVLGFATVLAWIRRPAVVGRAVGARWAVAWAALSLPIAAWLIRNRIALGDPFGTALKVERLGWGRRSLAGLWDHPLLTASGLAEFLVGLVPLFWRGEVAWHQLPLASASADLVYTVSTLLFLALAAVGLADRSRGPDPRVAEGAALVHVLSSLAVLAGLSLMYVFSDTTNPTAARPYFDQGRLVSGAILPFALLFVRGISVAASRLPGRAGPAAGWAMAMLAGLCLVASVSELRLSLPVFSSPYNFFHLP